jgi:hypothetical protein
MTRPDERTPPAEQVRASRIGTSGMVAHVDRLLDTAPTGVRVSEGTRR